MYTHFVYVEDDILLSYNNFCYFLHYRDALRAHGLIPSFQRVEYNNTDNKLYFLDQVGISSFQARKQIEIEGYTFVNLDFPHIAMYILDRELAVEYSTSRSFDVKRSVEVKPDWRICERASMGVCFENPPAGFSQRYVSPVDRASMTTAPWSWVYHLPNNYAQNRFQPFAKTRVEQLFADTIADNGWNPPSAFEVYLEKARRKIVKLLS